MGKAFASPRRLELLDLLAQAPRTVDELARASGQSTANTSQHLQALHAAGMVSRAREGTQRPLRARRRRGAAALAGAARRLGRAPGRGRARRERVPRRGRRHDRPRRAARSGSRAATSCSWTCGPTEEFAAGHIEGARSIPIDELERAARRAARRQRDRRLLPRPVLRLRPRGGPHGCAPPADARAGSRTAGPNGGSPRKPRTRREPHDEQDRDVSRTREPGRRRCPA